MSEIDVRCCAFILTKLVGFRYISLKAGGGPLGTAGFQSGQVWRT